MSKPALYLDLSKSSTSTEQLRAPRNLQRGWDRYPGAASMFAQRDHARAQEDREVLKLYTAEGMPKPKLAISDGNFTSPYDVVKGLGFSPTDETLWAHRVTRLTTRAPTEVALRKSVYADLREHRDLDPSLRNELARRILSLYRQQRGEKPLEKADATAPVGGGRPQPKGRAPMKRPGRGPAADAGPGVGKPANVGRPSKLAEHGQPGKPPPPKSGEQAQTAGPDGGPGVDTDGIDEEATDGQLLRAKLHRLHEMLSSLHENIHGSTAHVHMHNEIKAAMRQVFQHPTPDGVREVEHQVKHFVALVQGSEDPVEEMDQVAAQNGAPNGPKPPPQPGGPPIQKSEVRLTLDFQKADGGLAPTSSAGAGMGAPKAGHKYISREFINGHWVYKYAPGTVPQAPKLDDQGRPAGRHWIDHHPEHPTFESGGTAKKYGIDEKTGIPSDPERAKLHDEIISKHVDHVPSVPKGQKPVAIVTMGGPASGKTTALKHLGLAGRSDFVAVDPDAVKTGESHLGTKGLPEFHAGKDMGHLEDGTPVSSRSAAAVVHNESSHIADRIRDKAIEGRKNVIVDGTGKNADKHIALIKHLKAQGYHVHLVMPHQTAENANKLNAGRAAATGRYVPQEIVDEAYSKIPHNFEAVAKHADKATLFNAADGFPPTLAYEKDESGEKIHDEKFMEHFRSKFGSKMKKSEEPSDEKSKKRKKKKQAQLAVPQEKLDEMIRDAMHRGVQDAHKHAKHADRHTAGHGVEDQFDDLHLDIGIKRGSIKS